MVDTVEVILNIFVTSLATFAGIIVGIWITKRSTKEIKDAMLRIPKDSEPEFKDIDH